MVNSNSQRGFTLLEIVIAITCLSILMIVAAPGMVEFVQTTHVKADSRLLQAHLMGARSRALNGSVPVLLCARGGLSEVKCAFDTQNWSEGWILFSDDNRDNDVSPEEVIKIADPRQHSKIIFNQHGRLRFFSDGTARSAGFYICAKHSSAHRHIALLHSGRMRISESLSKIRLNRCLAS